MRTASSIFATCLLAFLPAAAVLAQNRGTFTASLESDSILYFDDAAIGFSSRNTNLGSHNYLKLNYTVGAFETGLQAEYYPTPFIGYADELKGFGLPMKYLAYRKAGLNITVGDFYEQFGSGLILRAWEDRQLGLNNSIGGGRIAYRSRNDIFAGKVILGCPRYYLKSLGQGYGFAENAFDAYSDTRLFGADAALSLSRLLALNESLNWSLEGSMVNRSEQTVPEEFVLLGDIHGFQLSKGLWSYSLRSSFSGNSFSVSGEYVRKADDLYSVPMKRGEKYTLKTGSAQKLELNYWKKGFSASVVLRRLSNMQNQIFRSAQSITAANSVNYIPALNQQQSYMLASLNPYVTYANGEMGAAADLYYSIKRGSRLGGKYGVKLHLNAAVIYTPAEALANYTHSRLSYRDVTLDIEKKWSSKLKTVFFMTIQEKSPTHGEMIRTEAQNVFVLDGTYRFDESASLRMELQYLYSQELSRDWMAALAELSFAPYWSLYAGDMYNHGDTGIHYYSAGFRYSRSKFSLSAGYGRHKEGMVCSGGVCRWQPAYTGGNIQLLLNL